MDACGFGTTVFPTTPDNPDMARFVGACRLERPWTDKRTDADISSFVRFVRSALPAFPRSGRPAEA